MGSDTFARVTLQNAEDLIAEGRILLDAHRPARAHALAQFAIEELGKTTKLYARDFRASGRLDWMSPVKNAELRDHIGKSRIAIFMQAVLDKTLPANLRTSRKLVAERQRSLYVDEQQTSSPATPNELISLDQAREMLDFAEAYLHFQLELWARPQPSSEAAAAAMEDFRRRVEEGGLDAAIEYIAATSDLIARVRAARASEKAESSGTATGD